MAYITLAQYKTYKSLPDSDDDTLLEGFILSAQMFIEDSEYGTNRKFEALSDTTRYFDAIRDVGDGVDYMEHYGEFRIVNNRYNKNRTLFLDHDLCSITSITNGDGNLIPSTEYVTEPRNNTPFWRITLKRNSTYYWSYTTSPENAISIVGKWAYSVSPDAGVIQIMYRLVDHLYEKRKNPDNNRNSPLMTDGGFIIMPADLPPDISRWISSKRMTSLIY